MTEQSLVSLSALARELGINKSKLAYYNTLGLIRSTGSVGGVLTFDHKSTLAKLRRIAKLQKEGKSLGAIWQLTYEDRT